MKHFASIEKLDTGILYTLELASSLSVLFLAFGLIASMANVLTKGSVLTDHLWMQQIWAWTQCIAIDASVAGTIIRTFRYRAVGEMVKMWLYALLSVLLLFTAAIVSNIEAIQQTLNVTLDNAYLHVFVPVEALIWIRSIAIVLLIVAHAMRHVQIDTVIPQVMVSPDVPTPEPINEKGELAVQTTVTEEKTMQALPAPKRMQNNYKRVKTYLRNHPEAKVSDVAKALHISNPTASKWISQVKEERKQKVS